MISKWDKFLIVNKDNRIKRILYLVLLNAIRLNKILIKIQNQDKIVTIREVIQVVLINNNLLQQLCMKIIKRSKD